MTQKLLLDTDILSEYLKGHDPIVGARAAQYLSEYGQFTFASVTVYEIVYGLRVKNADAQLNRARAWLARNEEIVPAKSDYVLAARIKAAATQYGSTVQFA